MHKQSQFHVLRRSLTQSTTELEHPPSVNHNLTHGSNWTPALVKSFQQDTPSFPHKHTDYTEWNGAASLQYQSYPEAGHVGYVAMLAWEGESPTLCSCTFCSAAGFVCFPALSSTEWILGRLIGDPPSHLITKIKDFRPKRKR